MQYRGMSNEKLVAELKAVQKRIAGINLESDRLDEELAEAGSDIAEIEYVLEERKEQRDWAIAHYGSDSTAHLRNEIAHLNRQVYSQDTFESDIRIRIEVIEEILKEREQKSRTRLPEWLRNELGLLRQNLNPAKPESQHWVRTEVLEKVLKEREQKSARKRYSPAVYAGWKTEALLERKRDLLQRVTVCPDLAEQISAIEEILANREREANGEARRLEYCRKTYAEWKTLPLRARLKDFQERLSLRPEFENRSDLRYRIRAIEEILKEREQAETQPAAHPWLNLLLKFMDQKAKLIAEVVDSNIDFYNDEDRRDLISFATEDFCEGFFMHLRNRVAMLRIEEVPDATLCPWCRKYSGCAGCGYAVRHGDCEDPDSSWRKIYRAAGERWLLARYPGVFGDFVKRFLARSEELSK